MTYLASCGDEGKIWDASSFSLLEQFNPFEGSLSDLAWSHDGNLIACCCSSDKTVHLRLTKTTHSIPSDSFDLPAGCQCLDYNSSSRFVLCGCIDGGVHIWDRKIQTIKKSYKSKHPVTVARWNWNDTYFALGSDNGEILLYNVVTGQASSPLVAPAVQTIRQMKYNPYRKSALVAVSDDGAVNFWDTNTRRLLHSFTSTHQAPAKDFAFSPINDCLMVSVGLDKRAVFYDIQNKTSIQTIVAEHPLTSVDMMHDGATVAVGTTRGKIYFYDMRQAATPVLNLSAHRSSVKHLSFMKKDDDKMDSLSSQSLRRQLPTTPGSSSEIFNQNNSSTAYQSPRNNTQRLGLDAFSPLGEVNKSSTSVTDKTGSEKSWMYNFNKSQIGDATKTEQGVFSPLRNDNSHSMNSLHNASSLLGNNSFLTQILGSAENSVNKDASLSNSHRAMTSGDMAVSRNNSHVAGSSSGSPPRSLPVRGVGASPSLHQMASPRTEMAASSSAPPPRTSPTRYRASPPRQSGSSLMRSSPSRHGVSFGERPEILGSDAMNGSAASYSPRESQSRSDDGRTSNPAALRNGLDVSSSPPRLSGSSHHSLPVAELNSAVTAASNSASSTSSSLRHLVQDLLREQLHEHQEHLKSEIKAMLGHPGVGFNLPSSTPQQPNASSLSSQTNPGIYHAEFIRNLIREELEDVKDFIHKEFWCVQVEMIKQMFQLQRKMEAGFAECMINPILLDEIERLREEVARLKKTF